MADKQKYTDEQLHEHFDCYDLNKNGKISWSELKKAIKRCSGYGDEEVETMARVRKCTNQTSTQTKSMISLFNMG